MPSLHRESTDSLILSNNSDSAFCLVVARSMQTAVLESNLICGTLVVHLGCLLKDMVMLLPTYNFARSLQSAVRAKTSISQQFHKKSLRAPR